MHSVVTAFAIACPCIYDSAQKREIVQIKGEGKCRPLFCKVIKVEHTCAEGVAHPREIVWLIRAVRIIRKVGVAEKI
jgi:hypothetical protein